MRSVLVLLAVLLLGACARPDPAGPVAWRARAEHLKMTLLLALEQRLERCKDPESAPWWEHLTPAERIAWLDAELARGRALEVRLTSLLERYRKPHDPADLRAGGVTDGNLRCAVIVADHNLRRLRRELTGDGAADAGLRAEH